jgi:hypothetical protein
MQYLEGETLCDTVLCRCRRRADARAGGGEIALQVWCSVDAFRARRPSPRGSTVVVLVGLIIRKPTA